MMFIEIEDNGSVRKIGGTAKAGDVRKFGLIKASQSLLDKAFYEGNFLP